MAQRRPSVPVHRQLSADLRASIEAGEFADGARLPTEAELAERYGVSRQTVRRAFQDLVAEGLVRRVPGQGTFPSSPAGVPRYARSVGSIEELMQWSDSEMELTRPVVLEHDRVGAQALGIDDGVVAVLTVRRVFEGNPFGVSRICLPPALASKLVAGDILPELGAGTVIGAVESFLGDAVARVQQAITATAAPAAVAELLDVPADAPVLRVERLYFDASDQPVELAITHYNPARYTYRLELRGRVI
jgi:DNA-binding GntR family transcriptional regulator